MDLTTAGTLGRFYKELISEGFTPDQAFDLVQMAARELMSWDLFRPVVKA